MPSSSAAPARMNGARHTQKQHPVLRECHVNGTKNASARTVTIAARSSASSRGGAGDVVVSERHAVRIERIHEDAPRVAGARCRGPAGGIIMVLGPPQPPGDDDHSLFSIRDAQIALPRLTCRRPELVPAAYHARNGYSAAAAAGRVTGMVADLLLVRSVLWLVVLARRAGIIALAQGLIRRSRRRAARRACRFCLSSRSLTSASA